MRKVHSLVRPVLEYSRTVWRPHQVSHCSVLDAVQRCLLRLVGVRLGSYLPSLHRKTRIRYLKVNLHEMKRRLCLPPLSARRRLPDLLFLHRVHDLRDRLPRNSSIGPRQCFPTSPLPSSILQTLLLEQLHILQYNTSSAEKGK
ncbi:hypothetical protein J6590_062741 [Homalodisca vitripennis]|nr:hypothetical protein J6590_062741 [Homalodisca vitripennis]